MFTDVRNATLLSGNQSMIEKDAFVLSNVPKDGKISGETVTKIDSSDKKKFAPLGICIGKTAIGRKRNCQQSHDDADMEPTKRSRLFLNDDDDNFLLYDSLAGELVRIRMPVELGNKNNIKERFTCKNNNEPIEVKTLEHLFVLAAKAFLLRFRLTDAMLHDKLDEFKVLINEHLCQSDGSEKGGDDSKFLPLEFRHHGPRFKNLCIACGIAGVVDFEEVCCGKHTGNAPPKCGDENEKRRYLCKNHLVGGLCFYCTILNRINRMTLINEEMKRQGTILSIFYLHIYAKQGIQRKNLMSLLVSYFAFQINRKFASSAIS